MRNRQIVHCSEFHRPQKRTVSYDIRNFLFSFPSLKSPTTTNTEFSVKDYYQKKNFSTKEDKIRDQHDRKKTKKKKKGKSSIKLNEYCTLVVSECIHHC